MVPSGAFRLGLAFAVMLSHLTAADVGRLAVLLFFYLSGYWVTRTWSERFRDAPLRFYLARYMRIAPLYFLVVLGAMVLLHKPIGPQSLTLLGVASGDLDPTGVAWSLDIELQFYAFLPLVAGAVLMAPVPMALVISAMICAAGFGMEAATGLDTVAKYAPVFAFGMLTYARDWRPGPALVRASLAGFAAMTAATMLTPFFSKHAPDPFDRDLWAMVWMLPLLPFVANSLAQPSSRLDRHLGNLSYPLYLVHCPVIQLVGSHGSAKLAAAAVSCVVAVVLYLVIDRPADRWRVSVTEGRGAGHTRPPTPA